MARKRKDFNGFEKVCTKCKGLPQPLSNFSPNKKGIGGVTPRCKKCQVIAVIESRKKDPTSHRKASAKYSKNNPEKVNLLGKKWVKNNPKKHRDSVRKWEAANKVLQAIKRQTYIKERRAKDPNFKLKGILRSRLTKALRDKNHKNFEKAGSSVRDLGCSIPELRAHLESKFYCNLETGEVMSWENHGLYGWHIDHIEPLKDFDLTDRTQFLKANHFTNLQPLWVTDHKKKSDRRGAK